MSAQGGQNRRHPGTPSRFAAIAVSISLLASIGLSGCGTNVATDGGATNKNTVQTTEGPADSAAPANAYAESESSDKDYFNTEEYSYQQENGFVSTTANPLSTVSADVDTASYCNIRRMIDEGYGVEDIPQGAVRIEEMLNYFHYDYDVPDSGGDTSPFAITATASQCPWNKDTQLLVLGFAAAPESAEEHSKSNLVFLIDTSGSMSDEDKLPLLKDSFAKLVENLDEDDTISIVTYSGEEAVVLDGVSGSDHRRIMQAVDSLEANGSTNGEAGLTMAYDLASEHYVEGGVNRIIMASDGDLNVGITSESDLYSFVDAKRDSGIYLSVLGFGSGNYKDNKMEVLADHGNGSYHYIDCIDEAQRVFDENLRANLVPFADDVKLQVEFDPAQVKGYRLIGYENRELDDEDFEDDSVDAGDVGPGSQFTVAYEVVLADSDFEVGTPELKYSNSGATSDNSTDWATCTLRYRSFESGNVEQQQTIVDASNSSATPDANWKLAASVIEYGMVLGDSELKGTATLGSAADLLSGTALDDDAEGFLRLVERTGQGEDCLS